MIHTLTINDEPWFVGKDVAQGLGYERTADAVRKHIDAEDRGIAKMATPSGEQEMTIINESGLYALILSSKLPTAKEFKRWVTTEVLPSIRKTGSFPLAPGYLPPPPPLWHSTGVLGIFLAEKFLTLNMSFIVHIEAYNSYHPTAIGGDKRD